MPNSHLNCMKLVILPGKPPFGFPHDELYDKAYRFWLSYWLNVRRELGLQSESVSADEFLRHDFVNVLICQDSVVAMINSTLLDFHQLPAASHSYVQTYLGEEFVAAIKSLRLHRMATLENIVADVKWRWQSARLGVSLGAVLIALALSKAKEAGCDGAFGAARADVATARIAYDLGARPIIRRRYFHGKPTDLVAWGNQDIRPHPVEKVNQLVKHLWAGRLDTTSDNPAPLGEILKGGLP